MKRLINEYTFSILTFISTILGIEIVFEMFKSTRFIIFIKEMIYGL